MVTETSIDVYTEIIDEGLVGERQIIVLDYILKNPNVTDWEITKGLDFADPNRVRPRRKELVDIGIVIESGKRPCTITKRNVTIWRVNPLTTLESVRLKRNITRLKCQVCNGKGYIER